MEQADPSLRTQKIPSAGLIMMMNEIGNYRVIRRIGKGAMGDVYEVEHRQLGVRYALKTFTLGEGEVDFLRARFMAEGRALARISHANVARVFDLDVLPDGTAYFVMDLVLDQKGEPSTLADVPPDDFTDDDRWRWLESLASALDCIHAEGIVHRDVKLTNILLNSKNDAVLVDFGISRYESGRIKREIGVEQTIVAGDDESAKRLVMGTGGYLAPELLRGEDATAAFDVYALGVVFFRLLTGMWYEPGTDAMRLLEPLDGAWREVLPPMLDEDPAKRPVKLFEFLAKARTSKACPHRTKSLLAITALFSLLAAVAIYSTCSTRSTRLKNSSPEAHITLKDRNAPIVFDLGEGKAIEMVECNPSEGARFWIGASHVTCAEWLRVMGSCRKGNDDIPITNMSMGEIRAFLGELNRRFASRLPAGMAFRLPSERELVIASTADGACAADASVLGVLGPSKADKIAAADASGGKWKSVMVKLPCRVRTKKPNPWGVYDVVGQGCTICRDAEVSPKDGKTLHLQLGPDSVSERSTVGEWGWNSTLRLAIGGD